MCVILNIHTHSRKKLLSTEAYEEIKRNDHSENYYTEKSTAAVLIYFLLIFKTIYVYAWFS